MDSEIKRNLKLLMNRGALVNGATTSDTFANLTDSLEAFADAFNIVVAGTSTGFEADGTGGSLWRSLIAAKGTFTTSSTTVPADTGRTEANNYWNGAVIVPLTGAVVGQARLIVGFANAGGVFTLDSELPFTAVPGLVEYVIIHPKNLLVPAIDSASNQTPAHVVGNKSDTNAGTSLLARNLVPAADSASNTNVRDVVGNKTDTNAGNSLLARQLVPTADSATNVNIRDVVGNKTDTNAGNSILSRHLIPTADVVTNVNMRDAVGGKADTAQYDSGTTSSLMRYMRALIDQVKELKRMDLYPVLSEFWANDNTGIDLNIWTTAVGSAGTVTRVITDTDFLKVRLNTVDAVDASTARITTDVLFRASAGGYTTSSISKRFVIEWECKFTGTANIDNATFVMGLVPGTTSTRATTDIIAFGLSADAIQTITDSGGVETTNLPGGITLTNRNKYRIEITRPGGTNTVEFAINETIVATHTTNIPSLNAYWTAFTDNEAAAAGANQVDIGAVIAKYHDVDLGSWR